MKVKKFEKTKSLIAEHGMATIGARLPDEEEYDFQKLTVVEFILQLFDDGASTDDVEGWANAIRDEVIADKGITSGWVEIGPYLISTL